MDRLLLEWHSKQVPMMDVLVKSHRPEDVELSRKRGELAELQSRLAELELQLLNLRLELTEFETLYCAKVGPLYVELDEVEALITEHVARAQPRDAQAAEAASNARMRADESRRAATEALAKPAKPLRSQNLRDVYRAVAKRLHPDLSFDDADRKVRERLMTEANLAYERGDEAGLQAILEEYESSSDTVVGSDIAAELIRVIRQISLANKRIRQVEAEIGELKASELFKLKTLVEEGTRNGTDILGDMVERLRRQVQVRREYLRSL